MPDPERRQLTNVRTIPGFDPSAQAYAYSVRCDTRTRRRFARSGVTNAADLDLDTGVTGGPVNQR